MVADISSDLDKLNLNAMHSWIQQLSEEFVFLFKLCTFYILKHASAEYLLHLLTFRLHCNFFCLLEINGKKSQNAQKLCHIFTSSHGFITHFN